MKKIISIFLIFNFVLMFGQKEKLILEYKLTYLPSTNKESGRYKLNKNLSEKVIEIKKSDTLKIELNSSDLEIIDLVKKEMKFKCSNSSDIRFENNRIILPFNKLNLYDNNEELIVVDGIPFRLDVKNKDVVIADYRDNLINTPYYTNLKNYYIFLMVIFELNKNKLKPFKYYFNKKVLYKSILNYYDYLNCDKKQNQH